MKYFQALEYLRYKIIRVSVPDDVVVKSQQKIVLRSDKDLIVAKVITGLQAAKTHKKIDEDHEYVRHLTEAEWQAYDSDPEASVRTKETKELVEGLGLKMVVFASRSSFDNNILVFFFTSEGNIDFRELVKKLASKYKKRILLRRVSNQDRAKIVGGIGLCGREECCTFTYYDSSNRPSMDAVRDQGIMIKHNSRIFGLDGKIKGCLTYERDFYRSQRKYFPHMKQRASVKDRTGKIIGIDLMNQSVRIYFDKEDTVGSFDIREVDYENKIQMPPGKPVVIEVPDLDIFEVETVVD